jgi:hypothetical protein
MIREKKPLKHGAGGLTMDEIRIRPCGTGWSYCDGCCDTCMKSFHRATNKTEEAPMDNYTATEQAYKNGYAQGLMDLPQFGEIFYRQQMEKMENAIYQAIVKVGISVDKDKIVKALTNAREFYKEGYEQGQRDAVKHGRWSIRCETHHDTYTGEVDEEFYLECSECHRNVWDVSQDAILMGDYRKAVADFPYCHCGCKMDLEETDETD